MADVFSSDKRSEIMKKVKPAGNKTYVIGLHFSETSKDTLEDKVKKLIKKDVEDGNL